MVSMQLERLAIIPAVVALKVIASPLKSIPFRWTGWPLRLGDAPPAEKRLIAFRGTEVGRKENGSLPVRLWPLWAAGVNREGRGEWWADKGGRGSACLGVGGAVWLAGPSSGMSSMDSELWEIPFVVIFSEPVVGNQESHKSHHNGKVIIINTRNLPQGYPSAMRSSHLPLINEDTV